MAGPKYQPLVDREKIVQRLEKGRRAKWWKRIGSPSRGFKYFNSDGGRITDDASLERIKALVIPPAWRLVRISPAATGRLQAIGVDTTGRIQYLYNSKFTDRQQRKKYQKIERFGTYLPAMRKVTNEHLGLEGFPKEKVLAIMLRLINQLYIRMGDEKSVRRYKTYGITTLKNRHLEIKRNGTLVFEFVGKSHIAHRKILVDKELAGLMTELKALGTSRKLFHYHDEAGKAQPVKPGDVNRYIKSLTSKEFSSKDLRTWGATLLAAIELADIGRAEGDAEKKKNIVKAVKRVAEQLGNTPTVCRGSYIHPTVIKAYENDIILDDLTPRKSRRTRRTQNDYEPEELSLLKLFKAYSNGRSGNL